jgi:hypothetical protein
MIWQKTQLMLKSLQASGFGCQQMPGRLQCFLFRVKNGLPFSREFFC